MSNSSRKDESEKERLERRVRESPLHQSLRDDSKKKEEGTESGEEESEEGEEKVKDLFLEVGDDLPLDDKLD